MDNNDSILKSVYCNYRGRVTVHDVHGNKVHELSGQLTYEKYVEIERRLDPEITEFDGLDNYRCIACELKAQETKKVLIIDVDGATSINVLTGIGKAVNLPTRHINQIIFPSMTPKIIVHGKSTSDHRGQITPPNSDPDINNETPLEFLKKWFANREKRINNRNSNK